MALLLLGVALTTCSLLDHPWRKADDYVAGLLCSMSEAELRAYSERYPQLEIRNPEEPELLIAWKGNTQIELWLGADGLTAYQVTWTYPLTNFDSQLKTDLCSGAKYVDLDLVGDPKLAGAEVWLDGERVGQLSRSGKFSLDVSLGAHELRIERPSSGAWSTELRYDESSPGHDRVLVSVAEARSPTETGQTKFGPLVCQSGACPSPLNVVFHERLHRCGAPAEFGGFVTDAADIAELCVGF